MNAVEIEEAVSELAGSPFDAGEFPFAFLTAFGNRQVTVQRLRAGSGNASDVEGGVLQRNNIHMAVCAEGEVGETLAALRASPKTATNKVKFILATDGVILEAEELVTGEPLACAFPEFADHFAFFLPLAGISTIKQIKENPVDIKATGRLNKLYIELLKENPEWATQERRPELNHFMARLIFCLFAEDTGIFQNSSFSRTVEQIGDGSNTHEVIAELFRAMATPVGERQGGGIRTWADRFPYVNGGLFSDAGECPRFSKIARTYLLRAASLNWQQINPDIFGSMIQAVADDDERGELGMHYTSVPNILKVLNPLFLDELRGQLEAAGDSVRKLRALRRRLASIRVFDPACGSGNFLVIAYKEMRAIENEIVKRIGDTPRSWIKLENFHGIEIKSFAAEIARLALLIAEFQCDCLFISQQEARLMVLPLHKTGQIHVGNSLRLDWLAVCPPTAKVPVEEFDLAGPTGRLALDENPLGAVNEAETYICGNPPYKGSQWQTDEQKADLRIVFGERIGSSGAIDYVAGWFMRARDYLDTCAGSAAFVTTNSINQGRQVALLWPLILSDGYQILFADRSFKWSNLATDKAGVTVSIVGFGRNRDFKKELRSGDLRQHVENISPYLTNGPTIYVAPVSKPISDLPEMTFGNMPNDDGGLLLSFGEAEAAVRDNSVDPHLIRPLYGSKEFTQGLVRRCIWVSDAEAEAAAQNQWLAERFRRVAAARSDSDRSTTRELARTPHRFGEVRQRGDEVIVAVPGISSENRDYLPCGLLRPGTVVTNKIYAMFDAPLWSMALVASRLHWIWIGTVCVRMRTDFSYSNTLGWNTFPVPPLIEKNKKDMARCAEEILLAREAHFPRSVADLYEPNEMPADLQRAHERNDETIERIYIGRRFRNDTERLDKLFDMYVKMSVREKVPKKRGAV